MGNLNPVLAAAGQASQVASNASAALNTNTASQVDLSDQTAGLQLDAGKSQVVIDNAVLTGQLATQADKTKFALAIGGDLGDTTGTQKQLADTYNQAQSDAATALAAVNAKRSIDPTQDFLGWISAQFTINNDINKYNSAAATADQAKSHLDDINDMISSRGKADNVLQTSVDIASVAAQAQKTSDAAQIAANGAKSAALVANATNIERQVSLSQSQLEIQSKVFQDETQQQSLAIAQAHLKIAQEQEQQTLEDKKDKDLVFQTIQQRVALGYKIMNPSSDVIPFANSPAAIAMMKGGKNAMDDRMLEAYRIGTINQIANPDGTTRVLATSPADMLGVFAYGPELSPAQRDVKSLLQSAKGDLESGRAFAVTTGGVSYSDAYKAAIAAKDPDTAKSVFNSYANFRLQQEASRVDGPGNPFYLPSATKIVAQTPGLQTLPLSTDVIAPLVKAGVDLSDPDVMFKHTMEAVQAGTIKLNVAAAGIATMYAQGARVNNIAKSFAGMGLAPPNSYNVKLSGTGTVVDMTKPQDVLNAMVKTMSSQNFSDILTTANFTGP